MATETIPTTTAAETLADLLRKLGDVPPCRVRLRPPLGSATEKDVLTVEARENRLCELVDGVLVEKTMGFYEARLALLLGYFLERFLEQHDLGIVVGADGMQRLAPGLVRIPDLSFISWDRLPGRETPREAIPELVPDLAVEILSEGNTPREMERKLREYFSAGVKLVWYVDPAARAVDVYGDPNRAIRLDASQALDGGAVLPGFSLSIDEWFARADRGWKR